MAKTLANSAIWIDTQAVASSVNQVAIQATAAELDVTTLADQAIRRLPGLSDSVISASGFWDSAEPDNTLFGDLGSNIPVTVGEALGVEGSTAYLLNALMSSYGPNGKIGGALGFSLKAAGAAGLGQGILHLNRTMITTGTSTVAQLPAVPGNGAALVASLHVTAASGTTPSVTVTVRSANNVGMSGSTLRATFNAFATIGSQLIYVPGPITDTYWQATATITGGTPSFTLASALGVAY